jgi:hypothetical protein
MRTHLCKYLEQIQSTLSYSWPVMWHDACECTMLHKLRPPPPMAHAHTKTQHIQHPSPIHLATHLLHVALVQLQVGAAVEVGVLACQV